MLKKKTLFIFWMQRENQEARRLDESFTDVYKEFILIFYFWLDPIW